jgi:hypothetical protein
LGRAHHLAERFRSRNVLVGQAPLDRPYRPGRDKEPSQVDAKLPAFRFVVSVVLVRFV